jgi:flagellar hook-associated protein 1
MAGLFDTLALGSRSLQTYRKAIDTTGHNLANVSTPGYTRQRLVVETVTGAGDTGAVGAGAEAARIVSLRNEFAQVQLQTEASLEGSLEVKDETLRQALNALQETIDRSSEAGATTNGISERLGEFFASLQTLSTSPASIPERQAVIQAAEDLAAKFNEVDQRLEAVGDELNARLTGEVSKANTLIEQIAELNGKIAGEEAGSSGNANDLRDTRQLKIEELAKIIKLDAVEQPNGAVSIIVDGRALVDNLDVEASLEVFTPVDGGPSVRLTGEVAALNPTAGSLEAIISVRDGELARVRGELNELASVFITEVNTVHAQGFSLTGSTGANFFTGQNAGNIAVNAELSLNASLLQAGAAANLPGDNTIIRAMADLADKTHAGLNQMTFSGRYTQTLTNLAQEAASAASDLEDQQAMTRFVREQRDSVSGVSLDEEMANLVMFQKAFQASAKLISMTDEMLATIIGM